MLNIMPQEKDLGLLEAKIGNIESRLAQAKIMTATENSDEILFGAVVKVNDLTYDDEEVYYLVGEGESNPVQNKNHYHLSYGASHAQQKGRREIYCGRSSWSN